MRRKALGSVSVWEALASVGAGKRKRTRKRRACLVPTAVEVAQAFVGLAQCDLASHTGSSRLTQWSGWLEQTGNMGVCPSVLQSPDLQLSGAWVPGGEGEGAL